MRLSHCQWLACPKCGSGVDVEFAGPLLVEDGLLRCAERHRFAVRGGIARFFSDDRPPVDSLHALVADEAARRYWRDHLQALLPERRYAGKAVLEMGGGDGRHAVWLAQAAAHVTVLDADARVEWGRALAGDLAQVLFAQGSPERPPLAPRRYDLVLVTVPPTPAVLEAAVRLARAGGEIVVEEQGSRSGLMLCSLGSRLPLPAVGEACTIYARIAGGGAFVAAQLTERISRPPIDRAALRRTAERAGLQLIEARSRAIRWRKPPFPGAVNLPVAQSARVA